MIDWVRFENFKCLEQLQLDLGRLTALVGPNGSGKTSVLQGIELLSQAARPQPDEALNTWYRFAAIFTGSRDPQRIVGQRGVPLTLVMHERGGDELTLTYLVPEASASAANGSDGRVLNLSVDGPSGRVAVTVPNRVLPDTVVERLRDPRVTHFASAVYLRLNAQVMSRASASEEERPRMSSSGQGLASVLAWMKGAAEDELAQITRDLARIVPGVRRIVTLRTQTKQAEIETHTIDGKEFFLPSERTVVGDRFELEFENQSRIPADLLSEGTVLALGLLTKLYEPGRPRLLLIDDIDRGLHLEAQARLVGVLRDLLALYPDLQLVCTTHSPYLLSLLDPNEVRVLALDQERHTRALPLTNHPEFEKWKYGTQTGELWVALGESWVIDAQASQS